MSNENLSIRDYLKTLDFDQLITARELADEKIKEIQEEEKITLFIVDNGFVNVACFYDDEFLKAKIKVCELIMRDDFKQDDVRRAHPNINVRKVPKSDVSSWMEINT